MLLAAGVLSFAIADSIFYPIGQQTQAPPLQSQPVRGRVHSMEDGESLKSMSWVVLETLVTSSLWRNEKTQTNDILNGQDVSRLESST